PRDDAPREQHGVLGAEPLAGAPDDGILPGAGRPDDRDEDAAHATRSPSRHTPRTTGTGAPDGWIGSWPISCTRTRTRSARSPAAMRPRSSRPRARDGFADTSAAASGSVASPAATSPNTAWRGLAGT